MENMGPEASSVDKKITAQKSQEAGSSLEGNEPAVDIAALNKADQNMAATEIAKIREAHGLPASSENTQEFEDLGISNINNPRILDIIAAIEFSHIKDEENKVEQIQKWKKMVQGQYNEAIADYRDLQSDGVIYGLGGYNRYRVDGQSGVVSLINADSIKATDQALEMIGKYDMKTAGS
jgi:hypothetical protein